MEENASPCFVFATHALAEDAIRSLSKSGFDVKKLSVIGTSQNRAPYERLYAQMLGARDQVAEAARRMPMETGDLYEEDHHRLEEAVAALDRVFKNWDAQKN